MTEELKPCPFCGKPAEVYEMLYTDPEHIRYSVGCPDIDCLGYDASCGHFDSLEDARAAWNRRPGCDGCRHKGTPASDKGFICLYCTRNFLDLYEPKDNDEEEE